MNVQDRLTYASPNDPLHKRVLIRSIETLTGQRELARVYDTVLNTVPADHDHAIWPTALQKLQIHPDYDQAQLAKVPQEGPLILIANHPYGVLDGLIICHLAAQLRRDFKILIHKALVMEPRVERYMLPVDFNETDEAVRVNIETKQRAMETLRNGGAIVIFPAGGISTTRNGPFGPAVDLEWKLFVTKLIQMTKATVLPIYFHGQNSRVFQLASQLSETLRLALIIHEVNRKRGETIHINIGDPIPYCALANIRKRRELLSHLREIIYSLSPNTIPHHIPARLPSERRAQLRSKRERIRSGQILGDRY
ncbi:MAG: lysophospholipid acyltransferase family protein [Caldilineaceae bacterium]|nr:lysophospholipid acyltransferase family protein [Caldilineaceae bacterium]